MSRTTAAATIQHLARSRVLSSGQSARNKEALEKLRALYLDERAISDGDIMASASMDGIRGLPLSRPAKRLGGQRSLHMSAGGSLTHSSNHSPNHRKKMADQSHHRHSADAFPGARILSLAPLRKPPRHALMDDLPCGELSDVGARKRWFDAAVKEEELRERETVKQLAREALDELSRRKKRAMPQLGGSIGSGAPDTPFAVSRSRSSSSFTAASNHLYCRAPTSARDGSAIRLDMEPPSGPPPPFARGLSHPRGVADPRLHPWVAPGTPAQWLGIRGPSSPTNGVRADSINMAKQRAREAHDDFMLSHKRAKELAALAVNMRSPMHTRCIAHTPSIFGCGSAEVAGRWRCELQALRRERDER